MTGIRLVLVIHHHLPLGMPEPERESVYRERMVPSLEAFEATPEVSCSVHLSGPTLEWLQQRLPEYLDRLRSLVELGRVELLGGGIGEPVLPMLPERDRQSQLRAMSSTLQAKFLATIRGVWLAEQVWAPSLAASLVDAGLEYTVLDASLFHRSGLEGDALGGHYLVEEQGRLLKVFVSTRLDPSGATSAVFDALAQAAEEIPTAAVTFVLGSEHAGPIDGLRDFCSQLARKREWIQTTTFSRLIDGSVPWGSVSLPESEHPACPGPWKNLMPARAEVSELYARMLGVSNRLAGIDGTSDLESIRGLLHQSQTIDPYWPGLGTGRPDCRQGAYSGLIQAEAILDRIQGRDPGAARVEVADFNLDLRQEVRLQNRTLCAFVRPARGGCLYELDVREPARNLVMAVENARGRAFVDHFLPADLTLEALRSGNWTDLGDFSSGTYLSKVHSSPEGVALIMERPGRVLDHTIQIQKSVAVEADGATVEVSYLLQDLPEVPLIFSPAIHVSGFGPEARIQGGDGSTGEQTLIDELDRMNVEQMAIEDAALAVSLEWSRPASVWGYPIHSSGSDARYQCFAFHPRWVVRTEENGTWEVSIRLTVEAPAGEHEAGE